ncbi:MAG: hypothetical protein KA371_03615 [Acidobacteria bacterium]|nr:hypothetical protein [Acidobacteriota bacterium]
MRPLAWLDRNDGLCWSTCRWHPPDALAPQADEDGVVNTPADPERVRLEKGHVSSGQVVQRGNRAYDHRCATPLDRHFHKATVEVETDPPAVGGEKWVPSAVRALHSRGVEAIQGPDEEQPPLADQSEKGDAAPIGRNGDGSLIGSGDPFALSWSHGESDNQRGALG